MIAVSHCNSTTPTASIVVGDCRNCTLTCWTGDPCRYSPRTFYTVSILDELDEFELSIKPKLPFFPPSNLIIQPKRKLSLKSLRQNIRYEVKWLRYAGLPMYSQTKNRHVRQKAKEI